MRTRFLILATLILLVAAALRLVALHQFPPGPHYDEAVNLLVARSIVYGGARPFPIIEAYQGREVLYMYLNAALLPPLGDRMFTFHLSNAWLNLLTIAASMALGRAMFRGRRGLVIGLAVGAMMALSFPQVWLGRQAFRAVTLPFCQSFALLFLWRGLRSRKGWGWLVAGGVFAGLALYTYMASRLFPVWLLAGGALLLLFDARQRGLRLRQGLVFFGVLGLVALPMGLYALEKPDIFLGRLSEVTQPGESVTLAESISLHLRMFFIEGDPYLRYNIPGRPYFTLPEGLLLLLGIGVALWRLLRSPRPLERVAYGLALLAPLMVMPSLISVGGYPPSHMRSLGMVPLIFVLVALGVDVVLARVLPRLSARAPRAGVVMAAMALLMGGLLAGQTYFAWAGRADLFYESDGDLAAAADWLTAHASDDDRLYVAARDRGHPTLLIADTPPVTWLGTNTLVRAPAGQRGLYIFPRSAPPPDDWLLWLEPGRLADLPLGPDERPAFEAFVVAGDAPFPALTPAPEDVTSRFMTLLGSHATPVPAGATATVDTGWQIDVPPDASDLTPLLQLEDANGTVYSRTDAYMTETDRWLAGEALLQRLTLDVPPTTPPGDYRLRMAWVARVEDRYIPYGVGEVWATVGSLHVERAGIFPLPDSLPIMQRVDADVAPGVRLLGFNPPPATLRPGEALPMTLFWQGTAQEPRTVAEAEARLVNETHEVVLWQGPVLDGRYNSDAWVAGEVLADHAVWSTPRDLPPGDYRLELRSSDATIELGPLTVSGVPRSFTLPPVDQSADVVFADTIALVGYSVTASGDTLALELVWNALQPTDTDYTVFIHLVDANGQIVAQRDAMPQAGAYSTSLWVAGEYVRDDHSLSGLQAGAYDVVVGLYSQTTGLRLSVTNGTMPADAVTLLNLEIGA